MVELFRHTLWLSRGKISAEFCTALDTGRQENIPIFELVKTGSLAQTYSYYTQCSFQVTYNVVIRTLSADVGSKVLETSLKWVTGLGPPLAPPPPVWVRQ